MIDRLTAFNVLGKSMQAENQQAIQSCLTELKKIRDNGAIKPPSSNNTTGLFTQAQPMQALQTAEEGFPKNWCPHADSGWSVFESVTIPQGCWDEIDRQWPGTLAVFAKEASMVTSIESKTALLQPLCDDLKQMGIDALTRSGHDVITNIAAATQGCLKKPENGAINALNAIAPALKSLDSTLLFSERFTKRAFVGYLVYACIAGYPDALEAIVPQLAQSSGEQLYVIFSKNPAILREMLKFIVPSPTNLRARLLNFHVAHSQDNTETMDKTFSPSTEQGATTIRQALITMAPGIRQFTIEQIINLDKQYQKTVKKAQMGLTAYFILYAFSEGDQSLMDAFASQLSSASHAQLMELGSDGAFLRDLLQLGLTTNTYRMIYTGLSDEDYDMMQNNMPNMCGFADRHVQNSGHLNVIKAFMDALCHSSTLTDLQALDQKCGVIGPMIRLMIWNEPFPEARNVFIRLIAGYAEQHLNEHATQLLAGETLPSLTMLADQVEPPRQPMNQDMSKAIWTAEQNHPGLIKKIIALMMVPCPELQAVLPKVVNAIYEEGEHLKSLIMIEPGKMHFYSGVYLSTLLMLTSDLKAEVMNMLSSSEMLAFINCKPDMLRWVLKVGQVINDEEVFFSLIGKMFTDGCDIAAIESMSPGSLRAMIDAGLKSHDPLIALLLLQLILSKPTQMIDGDVTGPADARRMPIQIPDGHTFTISNDNVFNLPVAAPVGEIAGNIRRYAGDQDERLIALPSAITALLRVNSYLTTTDSLELVIANRPLRSSAKASSTIAMFKAQHQRNNPNLKVDALKTYYRQLLCQSLQSIHFEDMLMWTVPDSGQGQLSSICWLACQGEPQSLKIFIDKLTLDRDGKVRINDILLADRLNHLETKTPGTREMLISALQRLQSASPQDCSEEMLRVRKVLTTEASRDVPVEAADVDDASVASGPSR